MEIGSNFEWIGVNWTWEYFLNNSGLSFKVLTTKARMMEKMMKRLVVEQ
jgi:hypothetical protein